MAGVLPTGGPQTPAEPMNGIRGILPRSHAGIRRGSRGRGRGRPQAVSEICACPKPLPDFFACAHFPWEGALRGLAHSGGCQATPTSQDWNPTLQEAFVYMARSFQAGFQVVPRSQPPSCSPSVQHRGKRPPLPSCQSTAPRPFPHHTISQRSPYHSTPGQAIRTKWKGMRPA